MVGAPDTAAAYLARRHFSASLADRLQRRPFLVGVERLWLIYQLLDALAHAHARGVVHGDVRSENIMVAEWCFCVLVDFAAHKPATLRDDGPAVLEHFAAGDGAQRAARCYVAPERLVRDLSPETGGSLRPPADVFAAGCVAAELLTGGAPPPSAGAARKPKNIRAGANRPPRADTPPSALGADARARRRRREGMRPGRDTARRSPRSAETRARGTETPGAVPAATAERPSAEPGASNTSRRRL